MLALQERLRTLYTFILMLDFDLKVRTVFWGCLEWIHIHWGLETMKPMRLNLSCPKLTV